jgi:two-component system NtrC family sensor kinase
MNNKEQEILGEEDRQEMENQMRQARKTESIGQLAAGIAHEIHAPAQDIEDKTRFLRDAFQDLSRLLALHDKLFRAAQTNAVTLNMVAEIEAAVGTTDVNYLFCEIPKAIQQSIEGLERVSHVVRAMTALAQPGTEVKALLDLNQAISGQEEELNDKVA